MSERQSILGWGDGRYVPNPRYYGFDWPGIQGALDRGQRLYEHSGKLGREQQELTAEKERLEHDLVRAQAGVALAAVGASLADAEIGDAGTRTDVPKAKKRLSWIEKRLEALGGELAGARLAVVQHAGEVESAFAVARQRGHEAREVQEANAQDLGELQELEGRIAAVRYRIQNREALGELVGLIGVGGIG